MKEETKQNMKDKRLVILQKTKARGGFWSYQGIPESLDDDSVIEAALVHLDLEDLPLLLEIWDIVHIKRVWKDRLVSQGKRMKFGIILLQRDSSESRIRKNTSNGTRSFTSGDYDYYHF